MRRALALALGLVLGIGSGADGLHLRVVTYNIHHGVGVDGVLDLDRAAEAIARLSPDIVGLNEVDRGLPRSRFQDQAQELARRLDMHYVFGANLSLLGGAYGNALLSRHPIQSHSNIHYRDRGTERRGLLHAVLDVDGIKLHVLVTHLEVRNARVREAQLRQAAAYIDGLYGPVVLMGDFNLDAGPRDPSGYLFPRLRDAWTMHQLYFGRPGELPGYEGLPTFDSVHPTRRIDYIFTTRELKPSGRGAVGTERSPGSDHLALYAEFELAAELNAYPSIPALPVGESAGGASTVLWIATRPLDGGHEPALRQLAPPGATLETISPERLWGMDPEIAAGRFAAIVLHDVAKIEPDQAIWLGRFKEAGGRLAAFGRVGLIAAGEDAIPPGGGVAGGLFGVEIEGWVRSAVMENRLWTGDGAERLDLLAPVGALHVAPINGAQSALFFGAGRQGAGAFSVGVATADTLYVGIDPLEPGARSPEFATWVQAGLSRLLSQNQSESKR